MTVENVAHDHVTESVPEVTSGAPERDRSRARRSLVLAAGRGRRMPGAEPKPLRRLLGLPLLAHNLLAQEAAGIREAVVVLGYRGERIRREVEGLGCLGLSLRWVHNERWRDSNGISVLAAATEFSRPFFLTMADHVISPAMVAQVLEEGPPTGGVTLAVDRDLSGVGSLDDATKVSLEGDRIRAIGKTLADYDAVDTGVFHATPELFRALRLESAENGDGDVSLSDGVLQLARRGRARAADVTGNDWHDVDTEEDAEAAGETLRRGLRDEQDGPIAQRLNRAVSLRITRLLAGTSVTPNQVSVGALLVSVVGGALAALGGYLPELAGGALFQFASVLDGTDGELAKLTRTSSERGEWVDTVCDNLSYLAFAGGVTVGVVRSDLSAFYLWSGAAGLAATVLSVGNIYAYLLREGGSGSARAMSYGYEEGEGWVSRALQVLHYLGKRDVFSFLLFALAIVGQLPFGLVIFGVGTTFLLLPATLSANVSSWIEDRRAPTVGGGPPGSGRGASGT